MNAINRSISVGEARALGLPLVKTKPAQSPQKPHGFARPEPFCLANAPPRGEGKSLEATKRRRKKELMDRQTRDGRMRSKRVFRRWAAQAGVREGGREDPRKEDRTFLRAYEALREVGDYYGFVVRSLRDREKFEPFVKFRQHCCWRLRHETRWTVEQIGDLFKLHYSTVIHAVQQHEMLVARGDAPVLPGEVDMEGDDNIAVLRATKRQILREMASLRARVDAIDSAIAIRIAVTGEERPLFKAPPARQEAEPAHA